MLAWILAFLMTPALAAACDTTFDGSTDNTWEDATNWSNGLPTSSTLACILGSSAVTVNTAKDAGALTLASTASLEVMAGGTLTVGGGSLGTASLLEGGLIFTGGSVVLQSPQTTISHNVNGSGGGQLTVQSGKQLVFANGADVTGGGVTVDVLGTLSISGSTGANPTNFDAVLNNNGVITNDGPVNVIAGGGGDGTWKLGSGTGPDEPVVKIGISNFGMNGDFTDVESGGNGHLQINDSTVTMTSTLTSSPHITVSRLDLMNSASGLDFSPIPVGDASVKVGTLNVGNALGLLEVNAPLEAQSVNMQMGNMLANGIWEFGQFHWGGGDIATGSGSTVSVDALDMNFEVGDFGNRTLTGDVRLLMNGSIPGTPTYTGGVGTSTFTLNNTSTFQIAPGAQFGFGDDLDILGTGTVVNEGIINKSGGTVTGSRIQPQLVTAGGQIWVSDSTSLNLDVAPDAFSGGVLSGTYILDGILSFPGTITSFAGQWQLGASGQITDGVGGPDALSTLTENAAGSTITVFNLTALSQNFTNRGVVDVKAGGTLTVGGGNTYTQVAGATTKLSGASSGLTLTSPMDLSGGTLQGIGTVDGDVVNSGGTVAPGNSPGTLQILGDFTQNGTGVYQEEIDGAGAGEFDKLVVAGTAALGGTLVIGSTNGYQPPDGQSFDIINAGGGVVGTWASVVQSPLAPYFDQSYAATAMVLNANSVSVGDVTVTEGNSGSTDATFTISLAAAAPAGVSVDWATQDGTATAGQDYTAASGTVSFAPGETTKTVTVAVTGDTAPESNENFAVNLSNPVGTRIRDGQGVGTITEDDSPQATTSQVVPPDDIDGFAVAPPPIQGKAVNVAPVSGTVLVRLPGKRTFVRLPDAEQVPVGTIVDARKGTVRLFSVGKGRRVQSADFFEGQFQVLQKTGQALTTAKLFGGSFAGCPKISRARAAAKRKKTSSVRHLWSSGSGDFRTQGRYATATIRGTKWLTDDRCNGTLIRVTVGAVTVRDLTLKKSRVLRKPKSYLAPAVKPKRR